MMASKKQRKIYIAKLAEIEDCWAKNGYYVVVYFYIYCLKGSYIDYLVRECGVDLTNYKTREPLYCDSCCFLETCSEYNKLKDYLK